MKQLFTIGYEGAGLSEFLVALDNASIDVLLDIRELPMSRRKGFSKTAFCEALAGVDIDYRHDKQLGSPRDLRHRLREDGDYKAFFQGYRRHLKNQNGLLQELTEELRGNVALMCYEKDPELCHRSSVVDALAKILDVSPKHLEVAQNATRKTTPLDSRQGVSTT